MVVKLIGDGPSEEWAIRAPNLRNLTMVYETACGGRVEDLSRLEERSLHGPNCAKFLTGIAQVTMLDFFCCNFMLHMLAIFCLLRSALFLNLRFGDGLTKLRNLKQTMKFLNAQLADDINEQAVVNITEYPRSSPDAQVIFMGRENQNLY
uniref:Uncharacterized protein n=1 Tax=Leersia perrieri TaxID=77586 RepID=A0A0D9X8N1_9ORYZ